MAAPIEGPVEILLVEDNPFDAELAHRAFRENNLTNRVVHVSDGQEALDYIFGEGKYSGAARPCQPRVIVLDLKLPKIDGLEVLRALNASEWARLIPVVVLTSSQGEQDLIESYKLGVNSYIIKPVDFEKFLEAVREIGLYWVLLNQAPSITGIL